MNCWRFCRKLPRLTQLACQSGTRSARRRAEPSGRPLRKRRRRAGAGFWNGSCILRRANACANRISGRGGRAVFLSERARCAHTDYFPGTTILRNEDNIKIIETVEQYRRRMLEHNVEGLLVLASQTYFEDSGTPRSDDDYGFEGLKQVLTTKLKMVKSLRYEIEYRNISVNGKQAEVEVFLDGSFELAAEAGDRYRRVNDYHRFVLEHENDQWKFVRGM